MSAIADLAPAVEVTAYLPLTDNMTGGDATRPGDVLTIRNAKTVEVLNTDAEGRLILADALSLASEAKPDAIIDLATLTGAAMAALGPQYAAVMGNDDAWVDQVLGAGAEVGERLWRLPLVTEYRTMLDSTVADMKNIGGPLAGAITAGSVPPGVRGRRHRLGAHGHRRAGVHRQPLRRASQGSHRLRGAFSGRAGRELRARGRLINRLAGRSRSSRAHG